MKDKRTKKELIVNINELVEKIKSTESTLEWVRAAKDIAEKQVNEMHSTFDGIGVPRNIDSPDGYGKVEFSLQARFTNYIQSLLFSEKKSLKKEKTKR